MKTNKLLFLLILAVSFCSYGQNPFTEMLNDPATRAVIDADVPTRAQVIADDLIVQGSGCVGIDCASAESFGFDTFRMKENNLRMHFDDTSSSASFPQNDWRFIFNDSSNGGSSYFAVEDATAARQIFKLEAGAPVNSLYLDSGGDLGIGTASPVVEVHSVDGNTPTLRLEQDGSSGFTAQTFDIASNETNFFIRDVTNGSKLPFKIKPNTDTNTLFLEGAGRVAIGAQSTNANASLTLAANNKGLLLNRMTTAQRASLSAVEGMMVYDTDLDETFVGNGTDWLTPVGTPSKITGLGFSPFTNRLLISIDGQLPPATVDLSPLANLTNPSPDGDIETRAKISNLQRQVDDLMARMEAMESCGCYNEEAVQERAVGNDANVATNKAYLSQNIPNPFDNTTSIGYFVPFVNSNANIVISNATGQILENRSIGRFGEGSITVNKASMSTGIYFYTLYADGKKIDTKRMVVE